MKTWDEGKGGHGWRTERKYSKWEGLHGERPNVQKRGDIRRRGKG